jgi:hypothetical protein
MNLLLFGMEDIEKFQQTIFGAVVMFANDGSTKTCSLFVSCFDNIYGIFFFLLLKNIWLIRLTTFLE